MMSDSIHGSLLGQTTEYVDTYRPDLLYPVPRVDARRALGISPASLPFQGADFWHAYELSWLNERGRPIVAMAEFTVPCDSTNIIESKSFKLYLNSFSNTRFASWEEVVRTLSRDLSACADGEVEVRLRTLDDATTDGWLMPQGVCVDDLDVAIDCYEYRPDLLTADSGTTVAGELLYSHLLRSRCPVTGQPDWASVLVRYSGPEIDPVSLLRYLVSLRNHQGFHEQIVERIFLDLRERCVTRQLTVYGRFTRRGGLDINPFRSDFESAPTSLRTVRQ